MAKPPKLPLRRALPKRPAVDDREPGDHDPPKVPDQPGNEPEPDGTHLYGVGGTKVRMANARRTTTGKTARATRDEETTR